MDVHNLFCVDTLVDKFADKLADELVENLFDRALTVQPVHLRNQLDDTTVEKIGATTTSSRGCGRLPFLDSEMQLLFSAHT